MIKTAAITGVTGQDGSYLAELLINKGYNVIGLYRRSSILKFERIKHLLKTPQFILKEFDITDPSDCTDLIVNYRPNEIYNLAAQSHVATSFNQPTATFEINTIGVTNLLENIRKFSATTRFYQASTSEMFGSNYTIKNNTKYQDENTSFHPQSPYAIAKLASHKMVEIYRQSYNLYCCSGILFNHESPRRGENFVTRKITRYIGMLVNNKTQDKLKLGNIHSTRDWGHAKDYVEAMHLMLNQDCAQDFVISSGKGYTVEQFLDKAFKLINKNYLDYIEIDPAFYRPSEVDFLQGDCSKAQQILNWTPKITFDELVNDMVESDIAYYSTNNV